MFPWIKNVASAEFIGNHLGWIVVFFALSSALAGITKKRFAVILLSFITALLGIWMWKTNNIAHDFNKREIHKLTIKTGPWKLTQEQKQKLIQSLEKNSGDRIIIASRMMDDDSRIYAEDIASALKKANWSVDPVIKPSLDFFEGIVIFSNVNDQKQSSLTTLLNALNSAGINFRIDKIGEKSIPKILPNRIYIVVGYRPK